MALNSNMIYKYNVIWHTRLPRLINKEEEILKLHLEDKISVSKLSKMFECDRKPIQNIIKKNGFYTRPSTSPELDGREDDIIQMYLEDKLTIQTISKKIGCSFNSIKGFLKRNNIIIRTVTESRQTEDGKVKGIAQRLTNPEDLRTAIEMYNNGEVLEKIGNIYNITPRGLQQKFIKAGIKMRTLKESANLPTTFERKKKTNLKNWGVEHPMQHPIINERSSINSFKFKAVDIYGRIFSHLQGYEPQGITYLIENYGISVNDIHSGRKVPRIRYKFQGQHKIYFPDIYVESQNLLIEVKCEYTYNNMLDLNNVKRDAAIRAGFKYKTIIFNNSGKVVLNVF
jgi:predicted DNA-binding protein YlxM (UPF0122 family)